MTYILTKMEIIDNGLIYSLPVWVVADDFKMQEVEYRVDLSESDIQFDVTEVRSTTEETRDIDSVRGKGIATEQTSDIEV